MSTAAHNARHANQGAQARGLSTLAVLVVLSVMSFLMLTLQQQLRDNGDALLSERSHLHTAQAAQSLYHDAIARIQSAHTLPSTPAALDTLRADLALKTRPLLSSSVGTSLTTASAESSTASSTASSTPTSTLTSLPSPAPLSAPCLADIAPGLCLAQSSTQLAPGWPTQWWASPDHLSLMLAHAAQLDTHLSPLLPPHHPLRTARYWLLPFAQAGDTDTLAWQIIMYLPAADSLGRETVWLHWWRNSATTSATTSPTESPTPP
jgi:type II secretory pathway pseudopilin PulG